MSVQLGKDIAAARRKAKLSGAALAERSGVSAGWIRQLETGRMKKPSPEKLRAIADELGLPLQPMLAMTDQLGAMLAPAAPKGLDVYQERQLALLERQAVAAERQAAAIEALVAQLTGRALPDPEARAAIESLAQSERTSRPQRPDHVPGTRTP